MGNKKSSKKAPPEGFINLQYSQALEMYYKQISLFVQIVTFLVIGDITLVGYAFSNKSAGILLVGALFPIIILYLFRRFRKLALPALYTAVNLEQKYAGLGFDWLASNFISLAISHEALLSLQKICSEESDVTKRKMLMDENIPSLGRDKGLSRIALVFAILGHILAPIILIEFFQWQLL